MINPKSISVGELYGHSDQFTLEWRNGILARVLLTFFVQTETELNKVKDKLEARMREASQEDHCLHSSHTDMDKTATSLHHQHQQKTALRKLPDTHSLTTGSTCRMPSRKFGMSYPACAPAGWRWVMLDGPVDSEWIENLNSVLDDSMVLCLSNGERIKLMPGSRVLFESDSLANASPATVSRCAIIFLVRQSCHEEFLCDLFFFFPRTLLS